MALNLTCVNGKNVNCTSDICTPCIQESPFNVFSQVRIVIYILAFILSLIGNGAVILVTLKKYRSKVSIPAFNLLLAHLALVDLLFSCNAFILIPNEIHNEESQNGVGLCSFKKYMRQTPFMASIGTITVIAIERYIGITSVVSRKWTKKRVLISVLIIWVFSIVIYIPNVSVIKVHASGTNCYESWGLTSRRIFAVFIALVEYIIPLTIIAFCNYKIIRVINGRGKGQLAHLGNMQLTDQQIKEQRKSVRILIAVVLGFAILCLPNQILFLYMEISNRRHIRDTVFDTLQMLGVILLLHTAFNPAVYSVMDKNFREDAKAVCCCCCKKKRKSGRASNSNSSQTKATRASSNLSGIAVMEKSV